MKLEDIASYGRPGPLAGEEAARYALFGARVAVATAMFLVTIKLGAVLLTHSVALLGSLLDSLLDVAASLLNLFALHQASLPADREHRFGHGKWEAIAGLSQAMLIGGSTVFLAYESFNRLIRPVQVEYMWAGIAVLAISTVATFALVYFQRRVIARTSSLAITADSLHYRGDLLMNASILVGLVLAGYFHIEMADGLIGLVVAGLLAMGAWSIVRSSFEQLLDHEFDEKDRDRIKAIVLKEPDVRAIHDLRTRRSGFNTFIQFHLEMDGDITLRRAHEISDRVEAEVKDAFPGAQVLIHEDPAGQEVPPTFPRRVH